MKFKLPPKLFVTGTDTDIGKTLICSMLCLGMQAAYYKPIQSGTIDSTDTEQIMELAQLDPAAIFPETHTLTQPLSPHLSARLDGVEIRLDDFQLPKAKRLVVEGAGGIMVPINNEHFVLDIMKRFDLPVILVARSGLGTINHSLLSLKAMREAKLDILGVVMSGEINQENKKAIETYGNTKVLAEIPQLSKIDPPTLKSWFDRFFTC